jgi:hypothetical protein
MLEMDFYFNFFFFNWPDYRSSMHVRYEFYLFLDIQIALDQKYIMLQVVHFACMKEQPQLHSKLFWYFKKFGQRT